MAFRGQPHLWYLVKKRWGCGLVWSWSLPVRSRWAHTPEGSSLGCVLGEACHAEGGPAWGQGSEASRATNTLGGLGLPPSPHPLILWTRPRRPGDPSSPLNKAPSSFGISSLHWLLVNGEFSFSSQRSSFPLGSSDLLAVNRCCGRPGTAPGSLPSCGWGTGPGMATDP